MHESVLLFVASAERFNRCGPSLGEAGSSCRFMTSLTPNKLELTAKEIFLRTVPWGQQASVGIRWVGCVFGALPACLDSALGNSVACVTRTPTVPAVVSMSAVTLDSEFGK